MSCVRDCGPMKGAAADTGRRWPGKARAKVLDVTGLSVDPAKKLEQSD